MHRAYFRISNILDHLNEPKLIFRYIFFLIEHNQPLTYSQPTPTNITSELCDLERRMFNTSHFLNENKVIPSDSISFRLFLSIWDTSVSSCLINDLKVTEPYYKIHKKLTKGQNKGVVIRKVRSSKFRIE